MVSAAGFASSSPEYPPDQRISVITGTTCSRHRLHIGARRITITRAGPLFRTSSTMSAAAAAPAPAASISSKSASATRSSAPAPPAPALLVVVRH
ncbi:hypothetical protein NPIL_472831 [Nephila pilipes]|uniref:Uncharacterized protein n=1 Tax=Nephila pilipes TaxID=299642 RepID=A0A8X6UKP6_NEPPI|nr:hypothetical protein NPIL_472831 [Nephila pilipes]